MNCAHCLDPSSNHTTAQHEQAERVMCYSCQENVVKDEEKMCPECLSDMAQYYVPDEGGNG
jgi:hypothetical protein